MAKVKRPSIFSYHDYRAFLRDWLDYLIFRDPNRSLRKISQAAGVASGYLSMVISGKRNLSKKALDKLQPELGLQPREISYLECLQILTDSNDQEVRLKALQRMQKFGRYKKSNIDEVRAYRFLSKWYHIAIREMLDLKEFRFDANWISKVMIEKLSKKEIRDALNFLTENGFVEVEEDGRVEMGDKHLECVGNIFKMGLIQFHKEMFRLAARSIDSVPAEKRNIVGHTLAIHPDQFEQIRKIMDESINNFVKIPNEKSQNKVIYHIGMVAFPLTKPVDEISSDEEEASDEA